MGYLIHISDEGQLKESSLQKRITTLGPAAGADFFFPSTKNIYFQIIEKNKSYQVLGLTPSSVIIHQGKKKQSLDLSNYDVFEIESSKFIFSKKPFRPKEDQSVLSHYQAFYKFSQSLAQTKSPKVILQKLLELLVEITKANKGFLISVDQKPKILASIYYDGGAPLHEALVAESLRELSQTVMNQVKETLSPIVWDNVSDQSQFKGSHSIHHLHVDSIACFPILYLEKLQGLLYLGSHTAEGFFDPLTVQMVQILLAQASLLLEYRLAIETLEKEKEALKEKMESTKLVGTSNALESVLEKVQKVAPLDLTVLILGETGTGKELIAREIHKRSPRCDKPFVAINCGAIPENLLESILFGHKKGAFTDAIQDKIGKFEYADGGSIFLDEIGEMPMPLQVKLLRVLQEKVIDRVGDVKEVSIDVRVIAATHQNIEELMSKGKFREDLYHRLNEVYLEIPPLRDRQSDILVLAQFFLDKHKEILGNPNKVLLKEAQEKLMHYSWPGNIRELENVIKRAIVFSDSDEIKAADIEVKTSSQKIQSLKDAQREFQKDYVRKVLALYDGDKTQASQVLGVSVRTLFRVDQ